MVYLRGADGRSQAVGVAGVAVDFDEEAGGVVGVEAVAEVVEDGGSGGGDGLSDALFEATLGSGGSSGSLAGCDVLGWDITLFFLLLVGASGAHIRPVGQADKHTNLDRTSSFEGVGTRRDSSKR
jgi:hypothetical protein